jgi:sugar phosphate permease
MEKIVAERSYGWVIVAAGGLIGCVAAGAMFALAVYLQPIALNTGWSRAEISVAMTLVFIVMGVSGFAWGMASDRFGNLTGADFRIDGGLIQTM